MASRLHRGDSTGGIYAVRILPRRGKGMGLQKIIIIICRTNSFSSCHSQYQYTSFSSVWVLGFADNVAVTHEEPSFLPAWAARTPRHPGPPPAPETTLRGTHGNRKPHGRHLSHFLLLNECLQIQLMFARICFLFFVNRIPSFIPPKSVRKHFSA